MSIKKLTSAFLFFLVLVVLAFLIVNKNKDKSLPETETENQEAMENEALDDQWLTYVNDKYGYEIKYHQDWRKQGENEPPYPPPPAGMSFSRRWSEPLETCDYEILAGDFANDFEGEVESLSKESEKTKSEAEISGEPAIKFVLSNDLQLVESYYFKHNDKAFRMGFNILKGEHFNICQQTFDLMLSSFKFK